MKICHTCKQEKELIEFGYNKTNSDGRQGYCKVCKRETDRRHYANNPDRQKKIKESNKNRYKETILFVCEYLKDHPCIDCNETNPVLLEFDHRGDKDGCVSSMFLNSRSKLVQEMAKCDVRCVRCHRLKTAKELGYYKTIIASFV